MLSLVVISPAEGPQGCSVIILTLDHAFSQAASLMGRWPAQRPLTSLHVLCPLLAQVWK